MTDGDSCAVGMRIRREVLGDASVGVQARSCIYRLVDLVDWGRAGTPQTRA